MGSAGDEPEGSRDGIGSSFYMVLKGQERSQVKMCWYTSLVLELGRLKQEDLQMEVNLDYVVRLEASLRYMAKVSQKLKLFKLHV